MNASIVCSLLAQKVSQSVTSINFNHPTPSIREQELANHLAEMLNSIINCHSFSVETETSLDHISNEITEDDSDDSELDSDFNDTGNDENGVLLQKFSLVYMKRVIQYYDEKDPLTGKRRRSWKSVQRRFRRVRDSTYLSRFRSYMQKEGTKCEKMENINNYVYNKFEQARELFLPVHDLDLRRWALKKAEQESLHEFVASGKWLFNFKIQYNICSRKVTKVSDMCLLFTKQILLFLRVDCKTCLVIRSFLFLYLSKSAYYVKNVDYSSINGRTIR